VNLDYEDQCSFSCKNRARSREETHSHCLYVHQEISLVKGVNRCSALSKFYRPQSANSMFRNLPAVLLTFLMVATFFILHAVEIPIPAWLSLRQTQQVINLLVSILNIIIAWILTQRRRYVRPQSIQCTSL
jgi:uncharacterized membrane protein (DUF485 family)